MDPDFILNVEITGFADGLEVRFENNPKVFDLSNWKDEIFINILGKDLGEAAGLRKKIRSLILYILNLRSLLKMQKLISVGIWLSVWDSRERSGLLIQIFMSLGYIRYLKLWLWN